jgi:hypothetical protein
MNGNGNKAVNVMQLVMDLEGKVRELQGEVKWHKHKYLEAMLREVIPFWYGAITGMVVNFAIWLVIKWWLIKEVVWK